ncbi:MAG: hypothetical protein LBT25_00585, partial [Candidatus Symbiothrix sp.]|nr:hypothetical protein [Candidatus Symbiothrix sp.]
MGNFPSQRYTFIPKLPKAETEQGELFPRWFPVIDATRQGYKLLYKSLKNDGEVVPTCRDNLSVLFTIILFYGIN